jgi:hypothetical protein
VKKSSRPPPFPSPVVGKRCAWKGCTIRTGLNECELRTEPQHGSHWACAKHSIKLSLGKMGSVVACMCCLGVCVLTGCMLCTHTASSRDRLELAGRRVTQVHVEPRNQTGDICCVDGSSLAGVETRVTPTSTMERSLEPRRNAPPHGPTPSSGPGELFTRSSQGLNFCNS